MHIFGITGTIGAWKGTVVEYLVKTRGFVHYSVRAFLSEEIARRGLPDNRDSMREVANDLRKMHGPAYIVEQLYKQALESGADAIIESIRCVGEAQALQQYNHFFLLGVDADVETRYARIVERGASTDHVTFAEFLQQEHAEMAGTDPFTQNIGACLLMAKIVLHNDSTPQELYDFLEKVIAL